MEEEILNYLPTTLYLAAQKHVIITDLVGIGFNPGPGGVGTSSNIVCLV